MNLRAASPPSRPPSGVVPATRSPTSAPDTKSRRHPSSSPVNSSICARREERNMPAAVSGARHPNIDASHCWVSPSDRTRLSSTVSSSPLPNSLRTHDCSVGVKEPNKSPQSVSASMSNSLMVGALGSSGVGVGSGVCSGVPGMGDGVGVGSGVGVDGRGVGVGSGVGVDGRGANVGVLVADTGSGVDVAAGPVVTC